MPREARQQQSAYLNRQLVLQAGGSLHTQATVQSKNPHSIMTHADKPIGCAGFRKMAENAKHSTACRSHVHTAREGQQGTISTTMHSITRNNAQNRGGKAAWLQHDDVRYQAIGHGATLTRLRWSGRDTLGSSKSGCSIGFHRCLVGA